VTEGLHDLHLEAYSRDDNVFALVAKMVIGDNESRETNEAWIQLHVCVSSVFLCFSPASLPMRFRQKLTLANIFAVILFVPGELL
jgi:hypothetical protein